jgi:mono/diheme cytochrome c family protein
MDPRRAVVAAIAVATSACLDVPKDVKTDPAARTQRTRESWDVEIDEHARKMLEEGQKIFRQDTFGSEAYWGGQLRLHEAIAGEKHGGVGKGLTPREALKLGLKVDVGQVPEAIREVLQHGAVSLDDAETTLELLRADAVVGVKAKLDDEKVVSVGITCALCHSTVDDSFAKGIGRRLDGWPNRDLDVGAIVALAPTVAPIAKALGVSEDDVRKVLRSWGPGKYDAELNQDGKAFRPDGKSGATVLPAAFGLAGVNLHTYTGWGSVTYWNAYVATTQMHGQGRFFDPRMRDPKQFPVAARTGTPDLRPQDDRITAKLAALHFYQLAIPAPRPPEDSYDEKAAKRGEALFAGKAKCATCHVPPLFTEPGWSMHTAEEMGIDDFQASRSPDKKYYRTTPLRGLFTRAKGGFYHDGRFETLDAVLQHYVRVMKLELTPAERKDLVEYLKSL